MRGGRTDARQRGRFRLSTDGEISGKGLGYFPAFGHNGERIAYLVRGAQTAAARNRLAARSGQPGPKSWFSQ